MVSIVKDVRFSIGTNPDDRKEIGVLEIEMKVYDETRTIFLCFDDDDTAERMIKSVRDCLKINELKKVNEDEE